MRTGNFGMGGFFGRMPFGFGHEDIREKWSEMTEDEKKSFVEEQVNLMNEHGFGNNEFFSGRGKVTIEDMDKRCEEWQNKSPEEKADFVKQRNETNMNFHHSKFTQKND
ncbi:MAG TPA: hypothetical protein VJ954_07735 [Ignavibacteriaceae bacterium]|nr:hypothetical protein [Ignavibacteriaceae bacterium]